MIQIQENLGAKVEEQEAAMEDLVIGEPEEFTLTPEIIKEVLSESEIPDATIAQIQEHFDVEFQDAPPVVKNLVDEKAIEKNNKVKKEQKLLEEVATLKEELKNKDSDLEEAQKAAALRADTSETLTNPESTAAPVEDTAPENYSDVFLRMKPEKAEQVKEQTIDGQKYLLIPVDDDDQINLNGVEI